MAISDSRSTEMVADLLQIVRSFPQPVADLASTLALTILSVRPDLEGKARLGWGSVNYRHPKAGFVCAIFPMEDHASLVFEHGRQLSSPLLEGDGKQVRYIRFEPGAKIPEDEIAILLAEAIALKA
ncbi:MAG: hypothetical protein JWQ89_3823 [Devosia sp.]|uniref:DUF1801 domain-containing protein n=1 Tax=Devosia sp. TaxID=1871048 RepID=UPI00261F0DF6|nr:DUF1801 domain-containing protein [Devosia sp.]MDB5542096.1 hypothetical protein [Devosia sp.]